MKKRLATILTVVLVLSLLPLAAGAAPFSNGDMRLTFGDGDAAEGTHYTYDGTNLVLLQSGGSYTLSGTATGRLRVVASATDITLTLDDAVFTGPDDAASFGTTGDTGAVEFLHGGRLRFAGSCAVTGGDEGVDFLASGAVNSVGTLAVEVGGADVTLTSGQVGNSDLANTLHVYGADLNITVGTGRLHCETSDMKGTGGSAAIYSYDGDVTITYTDSRGRVEAVGVNGAYGISAGVLTVLGAGALDVQGGIFSRGDIDLGGARVSVVNAGGAAVRMSNGGTLAGSGSLAATGGVWNGVAQSALRAVGDMTLAYTGDLTLTGGNGAAQRIDQGGGVYVIYAGDALSVEGALTVAAAPRSLQLTPGSPSGDTSATPDGFYAVGVSGAVVPFGDVPITDATVNKPDAIQWTRPSDGGEWVTVPATGGNTKANPHTGR